jgi:hypothetical protein
LLDAVLGDVAVAAEYLLREHCIGKALIGENALYHRGQQSQMILRDLAFLGVRRTMRDIAVNRGP